MSARRPFLLTLASVAALAATLIACQPQPGAPERLTLKPVSYADLPGWQEDDLAQALPALRRSCAKFLDEPPDASAGSGEIVLRARDWIPACNALAGLRGEDEAQIRVFFARWFRPYQASNNGATEGLFTGYYEPQLYGSWQRGGRFTVPLYGRPQDLVTVELGLFDPSLKGKHVTGRVVGGALKPYPTRSEIEAGALDGKAKPILWVDDPVEAFFLQIQGSGRVIMQDGTTVQVGYTAQNGRSYRPVGKILVDRGDMRLEDVSLQSIRAWLHAHPDQAKALMDQDAAYVFFRELHGEGPLGAEGVALTPERSLAVDPRFIPYGLPVWLDIESPESAGHQLRRLVVAQDTGGAIKGPVRGDVFWGSGLHAEDLAGHMRSRGTYYLLLPRPAAEGLRISAAD